jgi:hypothetical protein
VSEFFLPIAPWVITGSCEGRLIGSSISYIRHTTDHGIERVVTSKDLAPDRKKIPVVLGIPGYRGNREILAGYRTNSKSKI